MRVDSSPEQRSIATDKTRRARIASISIHTHSNQIQPLTHLIHQLNHRDNVRILIPSKMLRPPCNDIQCPIDVPRAITPARIPHPLARVVVPVLGAGGAMEVENDEEVVFTCPGNGLEHVRPGIGVVWTWIVARVWHRPVADG
jgi:hypothetical protein